MHAPAEPTTFHDLVLIEETAEEILTLNDGRQVLGARSAPKKHWPTSQGLSRHRVIKGEALGWFEMLRPDDGEAGTARGLCQTFPWIALTALTGAWRRRPDDDTIVGQES